MPPLEGKPVVNRLLDALPVKVQQSVRRELEQVELSYGEILCEAEARVRDVYFPTRGFISLVAVLEGGATLEVGLIGASLVLGAETSPMQALVQGSGSAWRIQAGHFKQVLAEHASLRQELGGYV